MRKASGGAILALLSACATIPKPLPPPVAHPPPAASPALNLASPAPAATPAAAMCRVGPRGGPPTQVADRGIGGTGSPTSVADRGIGGTGIIGVITGFASVCLAGQEVQYAPTLPVLIDGAPASPSDLRAGQLAAVVATGPQGALQAGQIAIRHEVAGPIEQVTPSGSPGAATLRIAGQRVAVTAATLGDPSLRPGDWVAVSGLRDRAGVIQATRIDHLPPASAPIRFHGILVREGGRWYVGPLEIRPNPASAVAIPGPAELIGHLDGGVFLADRIVPDPWIAPGGGLAIPTPLFSGIAAGVLGAVIIESFSGYANGHLVLARTQGPPSAPVTTPVELDRRPDGSLSPTRPPAAPQPSQPTATRDAPSTPASRFEPAPVPNRDVDSGRNAAPSGTDTGRTARPGGAGGSGRGRGR